MKQHVHLFGKRLLAAAMALTTATAFTLPAAAGAIGDGITPSYDEAYYATLDYYGNLTEGSVVKSYILNGATSLTDYGPYDEVVNLTDGTAPTSKDGATVFQFDASSAPSHFYFEGKTTQPFETLPWTISMHYTLNGVPTKAEELAGKTGVVEIQLDIVPNEAASEYAKNNYTLEAMALFNQDDILSLEAPGAQVQLLGNLRAVLYLALPGEEQHFTIRVGSDNFAFDGMTFLMVPATLSQLEEIAKLGERKDDLEDNYDKLSGSLDTLLDSLNGMSSSLNATAKGLDKLNEARGTISSGKGAIYEQADKVLSDLDTLNQSLDTLPGHLDHAAQAVDDTTTALDKVFSAARKVQSSLQDMQDDLEDLQDDLDRISSAGNASAKDLESLGKRADALEDDLADLLPLLAELKLGVGSEEITMQGMTMEEVQEALEQAKVLNRIYQGAASGALSEEDFTAAILMAGGESASSAASKAESMQTLLSTVSAQVAAAVEASGGTLSEEDVLPSVLSGIAAQVGDPTIPETYQKAMELQGMYQLLRSGGMTEEQFFTVILKQKIPSDAVAAEKAKALLNLYGQSQNITDSVGELCDLIGYDDGLSGDLGKLLRNVSSALDGMDKLSDSADDVLDSLDDALDAMDELHGVINQYAPGLKDTLTETRDMVTNLTTTSTDTHAFLTSFEALLKTSGTQLDDGTKQTLEGLAASLRATASSLNKTGDVKTAKNNISDIIEDTWNEYTGDTNNLLLMDATADAVSLTDTRNQSPSSIQVLLRTQEIKETEPEETEAAAKTAEKGTVWSRIAQMFKDFWAAITGIFQ
ncbi:hypothetical protein [Oscillibacter sp.]|uniref:hypothetical protein n=1 Tax=Oscillibacter sp. TaxID=1945593 RepID=UPI002601A5D5|nr:hypothetical protein [Oscillibacter sp.]MDD3346970.1 hypothetical protein [Oscillibacter sp.]